MALRCAIHYTPVYCTTAEECLRWESRETPLLVDELAKVCEELLAWMSLLVTDEDSCAVVIRGREALKRHYEEVSNA